MKILDGQRYSYDASTMMCISKSPNLRDPYEHLQVRARISALGFRLVLPPTLILFIKLVAPLVIFLLLLLLLLLMLVLAVC